MIDLKSIINGKFKTMVEDPESPYKSQNLTAVEQGYVEGYKAAASDAYDIMMKMYYARIVQLYDYRHKNAEENGDDRGND